MKTIARRLGVSEEDVVSMNRRLGGDASLNAPVRADTEAGEWQDWLVDDAPDQEEILVQSEELDRRRTYLSSALTTLNDRERRIFEARRLSESPATLEDLRASSASLASASARSRCAPSRRCRRRCRRRPRAPRKKAPRRKRGGPRGGWVLRWDAATL